MEEDDSVTTVLMSVKDNDSWVWRGFRGGEFLAQRREVQAGRRNSGLNFARICTTPSAIGYPLSSGDPELSISEIPETSPLGVEFD